MLKNFFYFFLFPTGIDNTNLKFSKPVLNLTTLKFVKLHPHKIHTQAKTKQS